MLKKLITILCLSFTLLGINPAKADQEADIQKYIEIFKGTDIEAKLDAANQFQWVGISDTRIFDLIAAELDAFHATDKQSLNQAAWYAKALAFSGQEKYLTTLKSAHKNNRDSELRKHIRTALQLLPQYTPTNQIRSIDL